ncbi:FtsW/RodA/SpoVE family cell cycle protein [Mesobacillus subterraneus]|uniref:FtsW/RodA/SpoVE family cell cycle protein n=1 Tax=Mesobacillus subterraneus TaxID=285983 RepID=UPI00203EBE81|nr:FtsW/RodA/SpoVE family cell cycle protein [Mesobacillus subterraneus]MCM3665779.1 FtsW/RodA/SpoVE family cell cycle protein [Mesobacillus subterraneus]MCM3686205.1 FtsW/RodA/SpoVE family cell cycle protein [Mesobacillus subterraneus]
MLKKILKSYDYSLIIVIVLLSLFGLVMVYSASMVTWHGVDSDFFYEKQKFNLLAALVVFVIAALFPYKAMKSTKLLLPMVVLTLIGLLVLFVVGKVAGNALSWIEMGARSIQPSELAKLSVIIYLSAVYAKKQSYINQFNKGVLPPLLFLVMVFFLIALQPDFGTAGIIMLIAAAIILSSGMNFKNIMKLVMIVMILLVPVSLVLKDEVFSEKRMARLTSYSNPFNDEQKSGYQLANAYYAIGSGGITGLGLGQSNQKLGYLPEAHTDFIIAVISEELGIFGVGFVLLSLAFIVLKGIHIGLKCKDPFGSLLAIGIASMIGIQSFVNLGGATGVIPLTGVPLPFVSYGGSSLLQLAIATGILVNVSMFVNFEEKYRKDSVSQPKPKPAIVSQNSFKFRS